MGTPSFVIGAPRVILRLEGLAILAGAVWLYAAGDRSWLLFGLLFLAPDLSFIGYLAGPRIGAAAYNGAHTYAMPATLAMLSAVFDRPLLLSLALIWAAHIGFDRLLGYGLKYPEGFPHTHLGTLRQKPGKDSRIDNSRISP